MAVPSDPGAVPSGPPPGPPGPPPGPPGPLGPQPGYGPPPTPYPGGPTAAAPVGVGGVAPAPPPAAAPPALAPDDPRRPILALRDEVAKAVVGQEGTLSGLVAALLVRGHVLLEGVPGTAKTLLVKALSAALDLDFKRLQFTPDLMPSDVIGQVIFEPREATFRFREGPVFTNILLADEINRTPPKTQSSLLESMEERQVSVEGTTHPLPEPFIVVATVAGASRVVARAGHRDRRGGLGPRRHAARGARRGREPLARVATGAAPAPGTPGAGWPR